MTTTDSFAQIATIARSAKNVLVASHLRPDADALGCTIAMTLWLRSQGIPATAWNEDGMPEKFRYLPESHLVTSPDPSQKNSFDLLLALDTSVKNRLGSVWDAAGSLPFVINLDHHKSNELYGSLNYIEPTAPATGQILFDFFGASGGLALSPAIAQNLYAAISTDTGSFQYRGTTPHTFEVAAELVRLGVNVSELSVAMYDSMPRRRLNLLRLSLENCEFFENDRSVCFSLSLTDVETLGLIPDDNEGIIDHFRAVDSVIAAVFFEELPDNKIRVSARSKDARVDVCKICAQFGGGGHQLASGARIEGPLNEVKKQFMETLNNEIRCLD